MVNRFCRTLASAANTSPPPTIQNISNPRSASMDNSLAPEGEDGLDSRAEFSTAGRSGDVAMRSTLRVAWLDEQAQDPRGFCSSRPALSLAGYAPSPEDRTSAWQKPLARHFPSPRPSAEMPVSTRMLSPLATANFDSASGRGSNAPLFVQESQERRVNRHHQHHFCDARQGQSRGGETRHHGHQQSVQRGHV